ncbi:MAG: septal ring lytic transglycosylase RlpA family protein [Pseudomonadota bacterium]
MSLRLIGTWQLLAVAFLLLAGCGSTDNRNPGATQPQPGGYYKVGNPYQIAGRWYHPAHDPSYDVVGVASWYGHPFHGRKTANGEIFDRNQISAAHPTLALPSIVRVTNLSNHRQIDLRVNDRGPFVGDRIIDLSQAAARELGFERRGTTRVRVQFIRLADAPGPPPKVATSKVRTAGSSQNVAVRAAGTVVPTSTAAPVQEAPPVPPSPGGREVVADFTQSAAASPAGKRCIGFGFIQVGAFSEPGRAVRLAKELDAAVTLPVNASLPSDDQYARVRLGPLRDQAEADAALDWLRQVGHPNAFLVKPASTSSVAC